MNRIHPSLYAVLAALLLLPGIAFLVLRLTLRGDVNYPMVNFQGTNSGVLVDQPLSPGPQGLQKGDIVMAINGRTVDQYLHGLFSNQELGGTASQIEYTVLRHGGLLQLDVPQAAFPLDRVIQTDWSVYVYIFYMELVSLFVFLLRPRQVTTQLFFVASSALFSSALAHIPGMKVDDLLYRWMVILYLWGSVASFGIMLAVGVHLMLIFPKRHPILARHPGWVAGIYLGVWIPMLLFLAFRWGVVVSPMGRLVLILQGTGFMSAVYFPLLLLSSFSNYRTSTIREKRQLRWVMWSLVIALVPYLVFYVVPFLAELPFQLPWSFLGVLWCVVPTSFAIAVLRERLFDIDLIINRTLVYVPLTGILGGLYSASITLFQKLFVASTGQRSDAAIVISTLILASTFTPIKNGLQVSVDKRFKEPRDPLKELKAFRKQVEAVAEVINTRRTTQRLLEMAVSGFQASCGAIYIQRDGKLVLEHASAGWQEGYGILSLPMNQDGVRLGVLMLGARNDQKDYSPEDRKMLQQAVDCVAEMAWLTMTSMQVERTPKRRSRYVSHAR